MNCTTHSYRINPEKQLTANVIVWSCLHCDDERLEVNTDPRIESDAVWQAQMHERDVRNHYNARRAQYLDDQRRQYDGDYQRE